MPDERVAHGAGAKGEVRHDGQCRGRASAPRRSPGDRAAIRGRIERAIPRARLVLLWEAVWPRLAPLVVLAGLFAVALLVRPLAGRSGPGPRSSSSPVFVVAAFWLADPRLPAPRPGPRRGACPRRAGDRHRSTVRRPPLPTASPRRRTIPPRGRCGLAHRERLLAALDTLKAGMPAPGLARPRPLRGPLPRDPRLRRRLRLRRSRAHRPLVEAFRGGEPVAATIARIDAWVTPPAYTGRAADLPDRRGGEAAGHGLFGARRQHRHGPHRRHPRPHRGQHRRGRRDAGGDRRGRRGRRRRRPARRQPLEHQVDARQARSTSIVRKGDREIATWRFAVEPDRAPEIAFVTPAGADRERRARPRLLAQGRLRRGLGARPRSCRSTMQPTERRGAAALRGAAACRCRCRSSAPATAAARRSAT